MGTLGDCVREYATQLSKGQIQEAYRGITAFMSKLRSYLERKYPDCTAGALYCGYMDMTYFSITPSSLRDRKLKVAVVFLHEQCRFELWLAGTNRQSQAEYTERLSHKDLGTYVLSELRPGVDSIIASSIIERPDFDDLDGLKRHIEVKTAEFIDDMSRILDSVLAKS